MHSKDTNHSLLSSKFLYSLPHWSLSINNKMKWNRKMKRSINDCLVVKGEHTRILQWNNQLKTVHAQAGSSWDNPSSLHSDRYVECHGCAYKMCWEERECCSYRWHSSPLEKEYLKNREDESTATIKIECFFNIHYIHLLEKVHSRSNAVTGESSIGKNTRKILGEGGSATIPFTLHSLLDYITVVHKRYHYILKCIRIWMKIGNEKKQEKQGYNNIQHGKEQAKQP